MVEAQTGGGSGGNTDHMMRLTNELKEARVDLKKMEADRDRLNESYTNADRDRQKLEGRLAQMSVELQETQHAKMAAESARNVAQDALAKAEVARHKSAEEALSATKARDAASTGGDDARRELERLRKKVADLEAQKPATAGGPDPKELQHEREQAERKLKDATARADQAERAMKGLQAEMDAAKTDAQKARAEAARARAAADSAAEAVVEAAGGGANGGSGGNAELQKAAGEVYESINDILSEMRNNMVLVQGELPNLTANAETMAAVTDAVESLVNGAETAKGALRGLRDLAQRS